MQWLYTFVCCNPIINIYSFLEPIRYEKLRKSWAHQSIRLLLTSLLAKLRVNLILYYIMENNSRVQSRVQSSLDESIIRELLETSRILHVIRKNKDRTTSSDQNFMPPHTNKCCWFAYDLKPYPDPNVLSSSLFMGQTNDINNNDEPFRLLTEAGDVQSLPIEPNSENLNSDDFDPEIKDSDMDEWLTGNYLNANNFSSSASHRRSPGDITSDILNDDNFYLDMQTDCPSSYGEENMLMLMPRSPSHVSISDSLHRNSSDNCIQGASQQGKPGHYCFEHHRRNDYRFYPKKRSLSLAFAIRFAEPILEQHTIQVGEEFINSLISTYDQWEHLIRLHVYSISEDEMTPKLQKTVSTIPERSPIVEVDEHTIQLTLKVTIKGDGLKKQSKGDGLLRSKPSPKFYFLRLIVNDSSVRFTSCLFKLYNSEAKSSKNVVRLKTPTASNFIITVDPSLCRSDIDKLFYEMFYAPFKITFGMNFDDQLYPTIRKTWPKWELSKFNSLSINNGANSQGIAYTLCWLPNLFTGKCNDPGVFTFIRDLHNKHENIINNGGSYLLFNIHPVIGLVGIELRLFHEPTHNDMMYLYCYLVYLLRYKNAARSAQSSYMHVPDTIKAKLQKQEPIGPQIDWGPNGMFNRTIIYGEQITCEIELFLFGKGIIIKFYPTGSPFELAAVPNEVPPPYWNKRDSEVIQNCHDIKESMRAAVLSEIHINVQKSKALLQRLKVLDSSNFDPLKYVKLDNAYTFDKTQRAGSTPFPSGKITLDSEKARDAYLYAYGINIIKDYDTKTCRAIEYVPVCPTCNAKYDKDTISASTSVHQSLKRQRVSNNDNTLDANRANNQTALEQLIEQKTKELEDLKRRLHALNESLALAIIDY